MDLLRSLLSKSGKSRMVWALSLVILMLTSLAATSRLFSSPLRATPSRLAHHKARNMAELKYRDPIVVKSTQPSAGTVFFLHGLGDSGDGWHDGIIDLQRLIPNVKFILPHAPIRSITVNMGMKMPGWFDIYQFGSAAKGEDEAGLEETRRYVMELVKAEIAAGTPSEKILIGGFSQGAAITYYTVYASEIKLGGAIALSGYLPLAPKFESRIDNTNIDTPLFAAHGTVDPIIPFDRSKASFELVEKAGVKGTFNSYKMGHSACAEELKAVASFIKGVLSEPKL